MPDARPPTEMLMIASGGAKKCFFQWNVCLCHFVINRVIGMISKKLNPCFQKIKD
jgi:hypothetical protein